MREVPGEESDNEQMPLTDYNRGWEYLGTFFFGVGGSFHSAVGILNTPFFQATAADSTWLQNGEPTKIEKSMKILAGQKKITQDGDAFIWESNNPTPKFSGHGSYSVNLNVYCLIFKHFFKTNWCKYFLKLFFFILLKKCFQYLLYFFKILI